MPHHLGFPIGGPNFFFFLVCSPDAVAVMKLLEYAALGKTRRMRKLLDRGGEQFPIDAYDAAGWTALHHACRHGHADAAQLLLRYPQGLWQRPSSQRSHLHVTYRLGSGRHLNVAALQSERGCSARQAG